MYCGSRVAGGEHPGDLQRVPLEYSGEYESAWACEEMTLDIGKGCCQKVSKATMLGVQAGPGRAPQDTGQNGNLQIQETCGRALRRVLLQ